MGFSVPNRTAPARYSMCVNDLFQFRAVAVHTMPDSFPARKTILYIVRAAQSLSWEKTL